jgi:hypothetical protein
VAKEFSEDKARAGTSAPGANGGSNVY